MNRLIGIAALMTAGMTLHAAEVPTSPLSGTLNSIDGESVDLNGDTGKVGLVVNVASKCGHTPQYGGLQDLHEQYAGKGLAVLGFPCNQFGQQEPGTEADIKSFCETRFGVEFPMFAKIDVNGDAAPPLYRYLTSDSLTVEDRGDVKWNFEKFLIDRQGNVVSRFRSRVAPDAPELIEAVEAALKAGDG